MKSRLSENSMQLLLIFAVVPCLVAANTIICPDLSTCPEGKTCCGKSNDAYECCDIGEDEKNIFPGIPIPNHGMNKTVSRKGQQHFDVCAFCSGTCCYDDCCEYTRATCCSDAVSCCPNGQQCCRRFGSAESEWCCPKRGSCASIYGYCYGGAGALIPAISSIGALIFLLVLRENSLV
ncbi:progranulin-like [Uloborus diversus]|uniref:progranulin-like n=1 Tax=Uloborus diversus TaxID=327109 RepID=UPI002409B5DD|nr:progranulin-like [Uloborus diversus]